jgi:hypothetical protein
MTLEQPEVFLGCPFTFSNGGVQSIKPTFSALFTDAICLQCLVQDVCNPTPFFRSILLNNLSKHLIFSSRPSKLIPAQFLQEIPAFQTLMMISGRYKFSYIDPISFFKVFNIHPFL